MDGKKILQVWDQTEKYLVGSLTTLALAIAFYQVVMRYVFNDAPEWAEETVLYLVIWCVFIIASKLVRDDEHIGADFIYNKFPLGMKRTVSVAIGLLVVVFCLLVVYYGWEIVSATLAMDERSTTRLRFPMWIAYLAVPSGVTLIAASYCYRLYRLVFRFEPGLVAAHEEERLRKKA